MAISWNILPNYEGALDKAKKVEFYPEYTPFQNHIPKTLHFYAESWNDLIFCYNFPPLFWISTTKNKQKAHC